MWPIMRGPLVPVSFYRPDPADPLASTDDFQPCLAQVDIPAEPE